MYFNTNHMSFWGMNRSGANTQDAIQSQAPQYGPGIWSQVGPNGHVFVCNGPDNNGGYSAATFVSIVTNLFNMPGLEWNGSAYAASTGWMLSHAGTFRFIETGSQPNGPNSSTHFTTGGLDQQWNAAATNLISLAPAPAPFMTIETFYYLLTTGNWTNDILNETHLREVSKDMTGTGENFDDEHGGTSGAFAYAINWLKHLVSTNIWTMTVDWNTLALTTNHCATNFVSFASGTLSIGLRPDRHSFGYDMPDAATGRTNTCAPAFLLNPSFSNAFFEVIRLPSAPDGIYQVGEDGSNIVQTTGAILRGGFNFFTVNKGAMWDQRRRVLDDQRHHAGYDTNTLALSNGGTAFGEQVYQSNAAGSYTVGNRDDALIASLQTAINTVRVDDTNTWNDATPTNHVLTFTFISPLPPQNLDWHF